MNAEQRKRLREIADLVERDGGKLWAMSNSGNIECGTPGCIIGWTQHYMAVNGIDPVTNTTSKLLGIPYRDWCYLVMPDDDHASFFAREGDCHVSHERAAAQLRYIADTGQVDWAATP